MKRLNLKYETNEHTQQAEDVVHVTRIACRKPQISQESRFNLSVFLLWLYDHIYTL